VSNFLLHKFKCITHRLSEVITGYLFLPNELFVMLINYWVLVPYF